MECLAYNSQTQCDKFINPGSYLQITELDHNQSLHNIRHKMFIWKTKRRSYQNYKDLSTWAKFYETE
jgi:hypothetical protein